MISYAPPPVLALGRTGGGASDLAHFNHKHIVSWKFPVRTNCSIRVFPLVQNVLRFGVLGVSPNKRICGCTNSVLALKVDVQIQCLHTSFFLFARISTLRAFFGFVDHAPLILLFLSCKLSAGHLRRLHKVILDAVFFPAVQTPFVSIAP